MYKNKTFSESALQFEKMLFLSVSVKKPPRWAAERHHSHNAVQRSWQEVGWGLTCSRRRRRFRSEQERSAERLLCCAEHSHSVEATRRETELRSYIIYLIVIPCDLYDFLGNNKFQCLIFRYFLFYVHTSVGVIFLNIIKTDHINHEIWYVCCNHLPVSFLPVLASQSL